jgi:diadenosine tetraphosphate (Ap4A) HIT family hydrolase
LHIHHIVRYEDDLAWPGPIWGSQETKPYSDLERDTIIEEVRELMRKEFGDKYV